MVFTFSVKTHLPEVLTTLHSGYPLNFFKTITLPKNLIMLPTPAGLPLSVAMDTVTVVNTRGNIVFEGLNSWYEMILTRLTGSWPNVRFNINITPR